MRARITSLDHPGNVALARIKPECRANFLVTMPRVVVVSFRSARCNDETVLHYCCRYGFDRRIKYGYGSTEKNSSYEVATVSTCAASSMASQQSNIRGILGT